MPNATIRFTRLAAYPAIQVRKRPSWRAGAPAVRTAFRVIWSAPGLRRTDLNATAAASEGDPAEAAAGAVRLALLPDDGPSGGVLLLGRDAGPLVEAAPNDLSVILGGACC